MSGGSLFILPGDLSQIVGRQSKRTPRAAAVPQRAGAVSGARGTARAGGPRNVYLVDTLRVGLFLNDFDNECLTQLADAGSALMPSPVVEARQCCINSADTMTGNDLCTTTTCMVITVTSTEQVVYMEVYGAGAAVYSALCQSISAGDTRKTAYLCVHASLAARAAGPDPRRRRRDARFWFFRNAFSSPATPKLHVSCSI
ncbi:hypothetical protein EVAR_64095_1 [Eumeta japonica]|uniref:Uncharacterized protein n=1 Tax=Eumeta variegata TaxID=151549 RepID=A0A4C1ZEJ7_EUMVA|nr:hypothetical protein EVAR_64095_1 [Eumeta japonica]